MEYAVMIGEKYFKEYVYASEEDIRHRGTGHSGFTGIIQEGDIIDVVLTDEVERTEVRRSIGNTITTLYSIEKMRYKDIKIIAINRRKNENI